MDLNGKVAIVTGSVSGLSVFIAENDYLNAECIRLDGTVRMQPR